MAWVITITVGEKVNMMLQLSTMYNSQVCDWTEVAIKCPDELLNSLILYYLCIQDIILPMTEIVHYRPHRAYRSDPIWGWLWLSSHKPWYLDLPHKKFYLQTSGTTCVLILKGQQFTQWNHENVTNQKLPWCNSIQEVSKNLCRMYILQINAWSLMVLKNMTENDYTLYDPRV